MKSLYEYCVEQGNDILLRQWHPRKNGGLTPDCVVAGSEKKVWWICEKGHEWQAFVFSRTGGRHASCPYCSNQAVLEGYNDLATTHPVVAAQWHSELNGDLTPGRVTAGSRKKVWWRCSEGHEWQAFVFSRTGGRHTSCPYCSNKAVLSGYNDLTTVEPEVAEQWHPELNGDLTPEHVTAGCRKKVWWICEKGHEWQAAIAMRAGRRKTGCPICAGRAQKQSITDSKN